jgi:hypothetical protein
MTDDGKASDDSTVDLDAEGKRLQLDAEKAKYIAAIAKSQQGVAEAKAASLKSLLPTVTDAPKGEVMLNDKAGAFGPWRAHQIIDALAQQIATKVESTLKALGVAAPRLLIVNDHSLLESDWTSHHVQETLDRLSRRVSALKTQISAGQNRLVGGIAEYAEGQAELEPALTDEEDMSDEVLSGQADGTAIVGAAPIGAPGAFGAAVNLLGLVHTDYTLAAATVTPGSAELVTLTAAHLAAIKLPVEADVFSTMRASRSMKKLDELLAERDEVLGALSELEGTLVPVEAELAAISARASILEQEWAKAAADAKGELKPEALRQAVDALAQQARGRERAAGPARTLVTFAQKVVADVDAAVTVLLQAPEGRQAPLFTAARRERLKAGHGMEDEVTHVLYVALDAVAADAVTRRSILGASGVLRFLTAGNASWLLLDTAKGAIVGGSQQNLADDMTFSLETGKATYGDTPQLHKGEGVKDPMASLESPAKVLIVVLAAVLAVLGVLSVLAVIRVVIG